MQQMPIQENDIVPVDYEKEDIPAAVKEFRPTVYRDGEAVCCILGPDVQKGIIGFGWSTGEALTDWVMQFEKRIKHPFTSDEVVQYIKDVRATSKLDVG
jgi:hypothetical protein